MRDAAKSRLGFYPAPPSAIELLLTRLSAHPSGSAVLDPCAGAGSAIKQIAEGLGLSHSNVWAIELERNRGEEIRQAMPEANVLAPASLFGCSIMPRSLGLIYCNPPFDDDPRDDRVEVTWLRRCTNYLASRGVMVFVVPEPTTKLDKWRDWWAEHMQATTIIPFPAEVRGNKEVFCIGVRRTKDLDNVNYYSYRDSFASPDYRYIIPPAPGPGEWWRKTTLTDGEILELLAESPLRKHLDVPPMKGLPRPPLALHTGHIALLLSCGALDGIVYPDDGPAHVIRGVAKKVEEVTALEEIKTKTETTTKSTITEKIILTIRAVDAKGGLHTLT